MPQIMRRTPATEKAMDYGYGDFLRELVGRVAQDTYAGFTRRSEGPIDIGEKEMMEMALAGIGGVTRFTKNLTPKMLKETAAIMRKFRKQGLTHDAFVDQIPDKPEFAYHQWTFRGEGPLARATVTTRGTGMQEFDRMVADRLRKFAEDPRR